MKSTLLLFLASTTLAAAGTALAVDMPAAGQKKCATCHAVDHKAVGPAFKDVAAKYKDKKNAEELILKSIKTGGSFGWKYGTMPPRGLGATDDEAATMAKFIVSLAK